MTRQLVSRRTVLGGAATLVGSTTIAKAAVVTNDLPWQPGMINAPVNGVEPPATPFLTKEEANTLGAIADRLIPADHLSISARQAGCVEFIDRQLSGSYGRAASMYMRGRFIKGTPEQGNQASTTPAERYRKGLAELDSYCVKTHQKPFAELDGSVQDSVLHEMEAGSVKLETIESNLLFEQILQNVREGFLSDPIYGGNAGMASWKMVGFPGARYDYRDYMDRKNEDLNLTPVSLVDKDI